MAQDQPQRDWPSRTQRWRPALPECTCRAMGRDFRMGETVCLRTAQGDRVATCDMALNNSSWTISDQACTVSSLLTPNN